MRFQYYGQRCPIPLPTDPMRPSLLFLSLALATSRVTAQIVEVARPPAPTAQAAMTDSAAARAKSPAAAVCSAGHNLAALERGFLDVLTSGAAQASVQVVRLCIGEPGRFRLPLYFLAGSPGNVGGTNSTNAATFASLLNPIGGFLNGSVSDSYELWPRNKAYQYTSFQVSYQASAKYVNGEDTTHSTAVPAMIGYADFGFRYQTGAVDLDDPNNAGIAWIQAKIGANVAGSTQFKRMFGSETAQVIGTVNVDAGITIDKRLNLKLSYETALKRIRTVEKDQLKVAFDFTPKS